MILGPAKPTFRRLYRNPSGTVDVFSALNTLNTRIVPDQGGGFLGWTQFGAENIGTDWKNYNPSNIVTVRNDIDSRNTEAFNFRTAKVRFNGGVPPFNLTALKVNDLNILSGPVSITGLGVFISAPLIDTFFEVAANSLWFQDNAAFEAIMDLQLFL